MKFEDIWNQFIDHEKSDEIKQSWINKNISDEYDKYISEINIHQDVIKQFYLFLKKIKIITSYSFYKSKLNENFKFMTFKDFEDKQKIIDPKKINIYSLKKYLLNPNADKFKKALIINEFTFETGLTLRKLAKELNISLSTLYNWNLYFYTNQDEFDKFKKSGMNQELINDILRDRKRKDIIISKNAIDKYLKDILKKLTRVSSLSNEEKRTEKTINLITTARDKLNIIEMRLEQHDKHNRI